MGKRIAEKLHNQRGVNRLVALLLLLVFIMVIVVMIPVYRDYKAKADRVGCVQSLDTAWRQMAVNYLMVNSNPTAEEIKALLTKVMNGWEDLCPAGGNVYIVPDTEGDLPWKLVCGLHDPDIKRRTRLNADNVLEQLNIELLRARRLGTEFPESLTVSLHHKPFTAVLVDEPTNFRRGTRLTSGVEGVVAYYSVVGHSDFGADSGMEEGKIWYFSYADEEHCATWTSTDGWSGDSYR